MFPIVHIVNISYKSTKYFCPVYSHFAPSQTIRAAKWEGANWEDTLLSIENLNLDLSLISEMLSCPIMASKLYDRISSLL